MVFVVVPASWPFQTTEFVVYFYSKMQVFSPCDLRHVVIYAVRCVLLLFFCQYVFLILRYKCLNLVSSPPPSNKPA
jgi:hypothetical protein